MKKKILGIMCSAVLMLSSMLFVGCNPTHTCEFSNDWTTNATHHWHACKGCDEKQDYEEHDWDAGIVIEEATATAEGTKLFVCEDCNASKTESYAIVTTVSEQEWQDALDLTNVANFQFTQTVGADSATIIKYGNIIRSGDLYISKEGNKFYSYSNYEEGVYRKTEVTEGDFTQLASCGGLDSLVYSDFTYNSETKAYEIAEFNSTTNFKIYFEDGVLVRMEGDSEIGDVLFTFEYEVVELTLPTVQEN